MSTDMGDGFSAYMVKHGVVKDEVKHERGAKIDAVLHQASGLRYGGRTVIMGIIEADSRNKFKDGSPVTTSKVVAVYGNIVKTESGEVYYVASWSRNLD